MKKVKYILATLLFITSLSVIAESWYQVEIIIFDRINPNINEEKWSNEDPIIIPYIIELSPHEETEIEQEPIPYMIMDEKSNRMNGVYRVLRLSSEYRPLMHLSWQQPATKRQQSRYIHIMKDDSEEEISSIDNQEDLIEPEFIEDFKNPNKIIDGSIRIRSGFFLHVDLNLYYYRDLFVEDTIIKEDTEFSETKSEKLIIGLKESRKIKLNEIHYFDNPLYGVILQVSRLNDS